MSKNPVGPAKIFPKPGKYVTPLVVPVAPDSDLPLELPAAEGEALRVQHGSVEYQFITANADFDAPKFQSQRVPTDPRRTFGISDQQLDGLLHQAQDRERARRQALATYVKEGEEVKRVSTGKPAPVAITGVLKYFWNGPAAKPRANYDKIKEQTANRNAAIRAQALEERVRAGNLSRQDADRELMPPPPAAAAPPPAAAAAPPQQPKRKASSSDQPAAARRRLANPHAGAHFAAEENPPPQSPGPAPLPSPRQPPVQPQPSQEVLDQEQIALLLQDLADVMPMPPTPALAPAAIPTPQPIRTPYRFGASAAPTPAGGRLEPLPGTGLDLWGLLSQTPNIQREQAPARMPDAEPPRVSTQIGAVFADPLPDSQEQSDPVEARHWSMRTSGFALEQAYRTPSSTPAKYSKQQQQQPPPPPANGLLSSFVSSTTVPQNV